MSLDAAFCASKAFAFLVPDIGCWFAWLVFSGVGIPEIDAPDLGSLLDRRRGTGTLVEFVGVTGAAAGQPRSLAQEVSVDDDAVDDEAPLQRTQNTNMYMRIARDNGARSNKYFSR